VKNNDNLELVLNSESSKWELVNNDEASTESVEVVVENVQREPKVSAFKQRMRNFMSWFRRNEVEEEIGDDEHSDEIVSDHDSSHRSADLED